MISKIFILSILILNSCASQKPNNISKQTNLDSISIDGDWEVISIHGQKDFSQKPNMSFSQKDQHIGGNSSSCPFSIITKPYICFDVGVLN